MITRFATLSGRLLVAAVILLTMTACGGGGGGGGGGFYDPGSGPTTYFLAPTLVDGNGNVTSEVTSASPATLRVTVTKNGKNGAPVANVVVTAATDAAVISPSTGTSLTDSAGVANFQVAAGPTKGAGTVTLSAESPAGTVTATVTFQVGASGLRLGRLDADGQFIENEIGIEPDGVLGSQALAQLSLVIVKENGDLASSAETVSFSSGCIAAGQAVLDPVSPITSGDGKVSTSYRAKGCSGNDQITASLEGSTAQALATISIAPPQANGFTFVDAVPPTIVLKGTGGGGNRSESSTVSFRVVDSNNSPIGGIKVNFALTTYVGGLSLSPDSTVSSSEGLVSVNVFSGDIPTTVRVIATAVPGDTSGQEVSSVSDILTVSTGLPDQDSISLSVTEGFVVEDGFTKDGITRTVTVRMADKFNNPVPDGTAASFTTEYGAIQSSCKTAGGLCSVTWSSQEPRFPTLTDSQYVRTIFSTGYKCPGYNTTSGPCPNDLGYTRGGRSTVLVTAQGEESFIDRNGNGIMDEAEKDQFVNLPEAFIDHNEDGIFNPAAPACQGTGASSRQCIAGQEEIFVDFNDNGQFDLNNDPAFYNGLLCPEEGNGVWCSQDLLNVRASTVLILSDPSEWYMSLFRGANKVSGTIWNGGVYTVAVSDLYNNRPPAGSTITLKPGGACAIVGTSSFTVNNTTAYGAFAFELQTGGVGTEGSLDITLTPKNGTPYTQTFNCIPQPPPEDPNDPDGLTTG
ncbi:MAG: hypothetical protein KA137_06725 [Halioglobus sp.]|nr:hypothetical protein [Halioglobus sp.]